MPLPSILSLYISSSSLNQFHDNKLHRHKNKEKGAGTAPCRIYYAGHSGNRSSNSCTSTSNIPSSSSQ